MQADIRVSTVTSVQPCSVFGSKRKSSGALYGTRCPPGSTSVPEPLTTWTEPHSGPVCIGNGPPAAIATRCTVALPENSSVAALTPVTGSPPTSATGSKVIAPHDRARDELAVGEDTADAHAGSLLRATKM